MLATGIIRIIGSYLSTSIRPIGPVEDSSDASTPRVVIGARLDGVYGKATAKIWVAYAFHYIFVTSANGTEVINILKGFHDSIPYAAVKAGLALVNPTLAIRAIISLILGLSTRLRSLALDLDLCQSRMMKDSKSILISTSEKWKAQDYGLQEPDMLCAVKHKIATHSGTRGGVQFVFAADRPRHGLEELLAGIHITFVLDLIQTEASKLSEAMKESELTADEGEKLETRAFDLFGEVVLGNISFVRLIERLARIHNAYDLESHMDAIVADPNYLSQKVMSLVLSNPNFPCFDVVQFVQQISKEERQCNADAEYLAKEAMKTVFVHLVGPENMEQLTNTDAGYSRDVETVVQGDTFILPHVLRTRKNPSVDILLDTEVLRKNQSDHWMFELPSNVPLTPDQIIRLNLAALHPGDPDKDPLVLIRVDPGKHAKRNLALCKKMREYVDAAIRVRKQWNRGNDRRFTGDAVGAGCRNDQRGEVGSYRNYRDALHNSIRMLHRHHSHERRFAAYTLFLVGTVLPGVLAHERALTAAAGLPPVTLANTCTTIGAYRNFRSVCHIEPPSDAFLTFAASFGSWEPFPSGYDCFCLPAVNKGRGVAIENGPGVGIAWAASKYSHTQATSIIPFVSTTPFLPDSTRLPRPPIPSDSITSVSLPPTLPSPSPSSTNLKRPAQSTVTARGGAVPPPPEDDSLRERFDRVTLHGTSVRSHFSKRLDNARMQDSPFEPVQPNANIAEPQLPFRNPVDVEVPSLDQKLYRRANRLPLLSVHQQPRGSGTYTKKAMIYRQMANGHTNFEGIGISGTSWWATPAVEDLTQFGDRSSIDKVLASTIRPSTKRAGSKRIADQLEEENEEPILGYIIDESGDTSAHDEGDYGSGASVDLATLPLPGQMITRSQARRMRELLGGI
ncbi:hypothetical protein JCM5353_005632 [Sporobolomyces roseus]